MGVEEGKLGAEGCRGAAGVAGRLVAEGLPLAGCTGTHLSFWWSRCMTSGLTALRALAMQDTISADHWGHLQNLKTRSWPSTEPEVRFQAQILTTSLGAGDTLRTATPPYVFGSGKESFRCHMAAITCAHLGGGGNGGEGGGGGFGGGELGGLGGGGLHERTHASHRTLQLIFKSACHADQYSLLTGRSGRKVYMRCL